MKAGWKGFWSNWFDAVADKEGQQSNYQTGNQQSKDKPFVNDYIVFFLKIFAWISG